MKERRRIKRHPWQSIAKPFAFKAWRKKNTAEHRRVEAQWQAKHPEFAK